MMGFLQYLESCGLSGLSKGKSLQDLAKKHKVDLKHMSHQLKIGIKIESEHTKSLDVAKTIAMDHLFEDPDYYTKLEKMEKEEVNTTASDIAGVSPGEPTIVKRNGQGLLFRRKMRRKRKKRK